MEDFVSFNPANHVDFSAMKIAELKSRNTWLIVGLVVAICIAGYYVYHYYQQREE